jgi:hypothetical protein
VRTILLGTLVVAVVVFSGDRGFAQVDKAAYGTLFISSMTGHNVTMMRNGTLLGTFTFPQGTELSVAHEHQYVTHLGEGRFEFHGAFELRALTAQDLAAQNPSRGTAGAEIMSHAPLVLQAQGVDVLIEKASAK